MEMHQRFLWLKCELSKIKTDLNIHYQEVPINFPKIEELMRLQAQYKRELNALDRHFKKALKDTEDLKLKVYIWHFCYEWPLKKIAKKNNYSLSHIKRLSSLCNKEMSKKQSKR